MKACGAVAQRRSAGDELGAVDPDDVPVDQLQAVLKKYNRLQ